MRAEPASEREARPRRSRSQGAVAAAAACLVALSGACGADVPALRVERAGTDAITLAVTADPARAVAKGTVTFLVETVPGEVRYSKEIAVKTRDVTRSPGATTYYVDARSGSDAAAGTSARRAWKSIDRVNDCAFAPGDSILFAAGQTFAGTLKIAREDGGEPASRVTVSSYGDGRATIDAGALDGIVLDGCAHVTVRDLVVAGCGRANGSDGSGIRIANTLDVAVDAVEVRGFRLAGINAGGDADTRITNIHAHDNGFAGIAVHGGHGELARTRNLYIGHCVTDNNPGDPKNLDNHSGNGIVVGGLDGGVIEYCESFNNGWDMPRKGNGPVGIWAWNCDRVVIQFCVSHDNKTQKGAWDGGGFDFDGGVTNSVLQYNLSYNNHGSGYLLCQYPGATEWKDNVCRYNISIDDGQTNHFDGIHFWAGDKKISNARVYNNLVVNARHAVSTAEQIEGLVFTNNVFVAADEVVSGRFAKARFEGNHYHSTRGKAVYREGDAAYSTLDQWAAATGQESVDGRVVGRSGDPMVALPDESTRLPTSPAERASTPCGRPRARSPLVGAGRRIENNGGRDFYGNPVDGSGPKNVGPYEGRP